MAVISINGTTYTGNNISVSGNKVLIDGKDVTPDAKEVSIHVQGNVEKIHADACNEIRVSGYANQVKTQSGDVYVEGRVHGDIQTMSGNVKCGNVGGSINTMSGDVKHRK